MPKSDDACGKHTSFPVSSAPIDLHGKTALVTGGARRVGRAIALELEKCGASVFVHCRSDYSAAERAQLMQLTPLKRLGASEDVAGQVSDRQPRHLPGALPGRWPLDRREKPTAPPLVVPTTRFHLHNGAYCEMQL